LQPEVRDAWLRALSAARFDTYLRAANGDEERALRLYKWNGLVGGAWTPLLGLVEVSFRNAIHDALTVGFGQADWWNVVVLDAATNRNLATSQSTLTATYGSAPAGRIVADLSFGNWVRLLGRGGRNGAQSVDYVKTLWRPFLDPRFKLAVSRKDMHDQSETIRKFRNRLAHHEPVLTIDMPKMLDEVAAFADIVSPVVAAEIRADRTIRNVLNLRP
jgi:hypothetical protein